MLEYKIRVNPNTGEVDYVVEGSYEELLIMDMDKVKGLNEIVKKITKTLDNKNIILTKAVESGITKPKTVSELEINAPQNLWQKINEIDERTRFPILWFYSTKPVMSVKEFLTLCAKKGFSLNTSWLPSVGGNFASKLVKEDKMFKEEGKEGGEKLWAMTDLGRIRIQQEIHKLESED